MLIQAWLMKSSPMTSMYRYTLALTNLREWRDGGDEDVDGVDSSSSLSTGGNVTFLLIFPRKPTPEWAPPYIPYCKTVGTGSGLTMPPFSWVQ